MAKKGRRSPSYPIFGIGTAIERLESFYEKEGQATVPRDVAVKAWGYSTTSGPALQTVSTLIQYGFLDRIGGKSLKITERGLDIIHPKEEADKNKAIQQASQGPPVFQELQKKYDTVPSNDTLKAHLVRREPTNFTENAAKTLIRSFRDTLDFTNLLDKEYNDKVEVGDLVNWESQGALQFAEPKKITGFSDCGEWVFVEDSKPGLPKQEIKLVRKADTMNAPTTQQKAVATTQPPVNPYFQSKIKEARPYNFPLPSGPGSVMLPNNDNPSKEDVDALIGYLELLSKRLGGTPVKESKN